MSSPPPPLQTPKFYTDLLLRVWGTFRGSRKYSIKLIEITKISMLAHISFASTNTIGLNTLSCCEVDFREVKHNHLLSDVWHCPVWITIGSSKTIIFNIRFKQKKLINHCSNFQSWIGPYHIPTDAVGSNLGPDGLLINSSHHQPSLCNAPFPKHAVKTWQ